jgi:hypothetical protein
MGQQIEYDVHGVQLPSAYLMVGDVVLHAKDQTAEVFVYFYANQAIRIAQTTPVIKIERVFVHLSQYQEFFADEKLLEQGMSPVKAAYQLLAKYPEPLGMKELFETSTLV